MKLFIKDSETYPSHELIIEDWVGKKNGILNRHNQEVTILRETKERIENGQLNKGAYQVKFVKGVQEEKWIPKGASKMVKRVEVKLGGF